jgi:hypothetical protein
MSDPASDPVNPLAYARAIESLLCAARDLMLDAHILAEEVRLQMIGKWTKERIDSLEDELLKEVRATIEALEKVQTDDQ